jgi:hypothetical protein
MQLYHVASSKQNFHGFILQTWRWTAAFRRSLMPNFAERGCRVVSATNPHGHYSRFSGPEYRPSHIYAANDVRTKMFQTENMMHIQWVWTTFELHEYFQLQKFVFWERWRLPGICIWMAEKVLFFTPTRTHDTVGIFFLQWLSYYFRYFLD